MIFERSIRVCAITPPPPPWEKAIVGMSRTQSGRPTKATRCETCREDVRYNKPHKHTCTKTWRKANKVWHCLSGYPTVGGYKGKLKAKRSYDVFCLGGGPIKTGTATISQCHPSQHLEERRAAGGCDVAHFPGRAEAARAEGLARGAIGAAHGLAGASE